MQNIKVENNLDNGSFRGTPESERKAQMREKSLLTFVVKATARDQEKNILISRLQREMSEAIEDYEALKTEVKIKDKILHAKEDELHIMKSENEALKQQLQQLLMSKKTETKTSSGVMKIDDDDKALLKPPNNVNLKRSNTDAGSPSTSPRPTITRKRSIKKIKDTNVAEKLFYNLRKKTKK